MLTEVPYGRPPSVVVGPFSWEAMGPLSAVMGTSGSASAVWPAANLALFYPFSVSAPITAVKLYSINGNVASGNIDLGIYDGAGTRLMSSGTTAQAGTTGAQIIDTTDYVLAPNVQYYMAMAMDNGTGTTRCWTTAGTGKFAMMGMAQMATAFPLPTNATYALVGQAYVPMFGFSQLLTF